MDNASGAGTTKRKELHGTKTVKAFWGTWAQNPVDVTVQAYRLSFTCDQPGESFSSFVLLTEAELDDEVATMEVDLFLIPNRIVKSSVSPCGKVHLDADQVRKSKLFHEFFFNGLYAKLFVGSLASGMKRDFLLNGDNDSLWDTSNMYLVLPIETSVTSGLHTLNICWKGIHSCACVVEYVRKIYSSGDKICCSNSPDGEEFSLEAGCSRSDIIYLADKCVNRHFLKDVVVFAIHTGKIYSVLEVEMGTSAEDPFEQNIDEKSSYSSYSDYFNKKYGIALRHPGQPLLLLKQSHSAHNLLTPRLQYEGVSLRTEMMAERKIIPAHMPPELLVHVDVSIEVIKSFYLLPSLMHRVESLLLASQLREEISCHPSDCHIPIFLILEAITTLRCCESFSLERLELLGDSVLKYAMSCHFFLKYPKEHEGQLSAYRSNAVCNMMLHKLGTGRNLQGYIRDGTFEPRRWVAPGQTCLHPEPCDCGVDTWEVPLESKHVTEETFVKIGKVCDRGHRWMCSKTIADCVESLTGAYYVSGGLGMATALMRWLGMDAELDPKLILEAKAKASLWCYFPKLKEIEALESKIRYSFSVKGLLLEAITHPSQRDLGIGYCYQRLEFLGDSLLDLFITWHLFQSYKHIDPGELTDLRSANVNNEIFAESAVRHNLHQHLQHSSRVLLEQERGISNAQHVPRRKQGQNMVGLLSTSESSQDLSRVVGLDLYSNDSCAVKLKEPRVAVELVIKMQQGGPRCALFELCKMHQWPMPEFDMTEDVSRDPIEFNGLFGTRTGFNAFTSSITLHMLNHAVIRLDGGQEADKSCSKDSAAYRMLLELERLGWCIILHKKIHDSAYELYKPVTTSTCDAEMYICI